ncbi:MAG: putative transposase, partial [Pirellulaceae bacterium]
MSFLLQPFHVFVAVLSEYVRKQQELVIEYLQLENQILREQIGGKRVLLTDDQRRLLAVKGKALGRKQLGKI